MEKIFLFELGTEELPSNILQNLSESFFNNFKKLLTVYHIKYEKIFLFTTPRRIAIKLYLLNNENYYSFSEEKKLIDSLDTSIKKKNDPKNIIYFLSKIINFSIKKIISSKLMKWDSNEYRFYRPVRNVLALLNKEIVNIKLFNISADRKTIGHLLMHNQKITINHANEYPLLLKNIGKVISNYEERKKIIYEKILKKIKKINGIPKINKNLLEETTSLVEWPSILMGKFEEKFLKIPVKILIHVIQNIQKCFPIYKTSSKLKNHFLIVANIIVKDYKKIIFGNETVIHSRLLDIQFFLKKDTAIALENYLPALKNIIFQEKIGTLFDKTMRLKKLSKWISKFTKANLKDSIRAALLSKCDLVTNMVFEFPELQGTIGSYYASCNNESSSVIHAIQDQYYLFKKKKKILFHPVSCTLLIADKIDTISSIFLINKIPSGDKDPFSLRRAALGIIKIILFNQININLTELIKNSIKNMSSNNDLKITFQIKKFILNRLFSFYKDQGFSVKIVKSVFYLELDELIEINNRIIQISSLNEKLNLLVKMYKRIQNILKKNSEKINTAINENFLIDTNEIELFFAFKKSKKIIKKFLDKKKYKDSLLEVINLQSFIENFFKKTTIFHKNDNIRLNRLSLLYFIKKIFLKITNFSLLI
ncbi:glycine--tRNA ligase subunit beta [Buchnera aphidicola]|uniref:glycine--tRNA ligase subunit beta n=1 Tax=Buchnera aphidicola TaxID=9 RepID=UPI0031B67A37